MILLKRKRKIIFQENSADPKVYVSRAKTPAFCGRFFILYCNLNRYYSKFPPMRQTKSDLIDSLEIIFLRFEELLLRLPERNYARPLHLLSGASIGKQVRHCLEFAEALLNGYDIRFVTYDQRERNPIYENSPEAAAYRFQELVREFKLKDWEGEVEVSYLVHSSSGSENVVKSSWDRELLYVQEHTIHHEAIVRVALEHDLGFDDIPESFGFAISTLQYKANLSILAWDPVI